MKKLTTAIYTEVAPKIAISKVTGRRISVSGILNKPNVSRSGYRAFLNHKPSDSEKRKVCAKKQIQQIYDNSHQN